MQEVEPFTFLVTKKPPIMVEHFEFQGL